MNSARDYLLRVIDSYRDEMMVLIMDSVGEYDVHADVEVVFGMEAVKFRHVQLFIARHLRSYYRVRCISKHDARCLRLEMLQCLFDIRSEVHQHLGWLYAHHALGDEMYKSIRSHF